MVRAGTHPVMAAGLPAAPGVVRPLNDAVRLRSFVTPCGVQFRRNSGRDNAPDVTARREEIRSP